MAGYHDNNNTGSASSEEARRICVVSTIMFTGRTRSRSSFPRWLCVAITVTLLVVVTVVKEPKKK